MNSEQAYLDQSNIWSNRLAGHRPISFMSPKFIGYYVILARNAISPMQFSPMQDLN